MENLIDFLSPETTAFLVRKIYRAIREALLATDSYYAPSLEADEWYDRDFNDIAKDKSQLVSKIKVATGVEDEYFVATIGFVLDSQSYKKKIISIHPALVQAFTEAKNDLYTLPT